MGNWRMSCWKLKEDGGEDWVWCGKGEKREGKWVLTTFFIAKYMVCMTTFLHMRDHYFFIN
jgi:hypothetical protein